MKEQFDVNLLEDALRALGDTLEARGLSISLVAIGGGAMLLSNLCSRPTADIDIVAVVNDDGSYGTSRPLPVHVKVCCDEVADYLGLDKSWIKGGPTMLLDHGLPEGFTERVTTRTYGGLTLFLAARFDQICFKLYAAVDQGPRSKHAQDLHGLAPTEDELLVAARWVQTHDASEGFKEMLILALKYFGVEDVDERL